MTSFSTSDSPPARESVTWHLLWRAAVGRNLVQPPLLGERIRGRLIDAHRRPGRELLLYLVTPGEIHVLSRLAPDESATRLARAVGHIVARWMRQLQQVRSPVFAGRFKERRIPSDVALRGEIHMLAWRPVMLRLCRSPTHHRLGAVRVALGLTPRRDFDPRPLLSLFGERVPAARARLSLMLRTRPDDEACRRWELLCGLPMSAGLPGPVPASTPMPFASELAGGLLAAAGEAGLTGVLAMIERWVLSQPELRPSRRRPPPGVLAPRARALVACLAVSSGLCSASFLARHYGCAKATLSEQMAECRRRLDLARLLQDYAEQILQVRKREGGASRGPA